MEVFRLDREIHSNALSGKGAAIKGGRWNSPGTEIIYVAANRSLAMAEVAVHFTLATIPEDYMLLTILIPDTISLLKVKSSNLPADWNVFPYTASSQFIGDKFILENKFCILQVPSAVTKGDYNFLINPFHSEFKKIKIISTEKFPFDKRIFK